MQSLFATEDQRANPQNGFWQRLKQPLSPDTAQHHGWLSIQRSAGGWKRRFFCLSRNWLLVCKEEGRPAHKYVVLSWKVFEPFAETSPRGLNFGFRLGSAANEDFYVDSQEDLDQWIEELQSICLLVDLNRDFRLLRPLGRGTYAEVMLAESCEDNSLVAVKSVKKSLLSTADNLEHHVQEIKALHKLQHPRIVRLLRVYEDEHYLHLVTDFLTGGDLCNRILARRRYPELKAASLFRKILEVVAYIHEEGIVHRDIKPENILMTEDDCEFKLGDFGLAAEVVEGLHQCCGSPGFLAPEMLRRPTYNKQVDMFSCGVLLYYLLCGKMPFEGGSPSEVLTKNRECRIYFQPQLWSNISKTAIELVLKLTHPDPLQRLTPKQALEHTWLSAQEPGSPAQPARMRATGVRTVATCDRVSHEFMSRSVKKAEPQQCPPMLPTRVKKLPKLPVAEEALDERRVSLSVRGESSPRPGLLVVALNTAGK